MNSRGFWLFQSFCWISQIRYQEKRTQVFSEDIQWISLLSHSLPQVTELFFLSYRTAATHLLNRHNFCSRWNSKYCIRLLLCMTLLQSQSRKHSQYMVTLQGETHKRGLLYHLHTPAHRITPLRTPLAVLFQALHFLNVTYGMLLLLLPFFFFKPKMRHPLY